MPFGLLNIQKPPRVTSADVVGWLKRLVRPDKIGHAGTLSDPIAEGVLVVAVGSATRLIDYVQQMPKRYWATFLLGRRSPSDDTEIVAEELVDPPIPSVADLSAVTALVGEIQQRPPAFSAVKVAGRRDQLARAGRTVDLAARAGHGVRISSPNTSIRALCSTFAAVWARMFARWGVIWRNRWVPPL